MVRLSLLGISTALASAIYVLENFIPFPLPVGRWGFSNSVVLYFATVSLKDSLIVAAGKSFLGSLFSGRLLSPTFWMGFFGSLSAAVVERGLFKLGFGYIGASLAGSAVNNLVQLLVGSMIVGTIHTVYLFPLLAGMGSLSAVANVYLAKSYERAVEVRS